MILDMILSGSGLGSIVSGTLEGLGIPWPGAVVLTTAGTKFPGVQGALLLGTLFAICYTFGSAVQYAFGRFCRGLLERFLSASMREKLEQAIEKYGQAAVLWTRPLAVDNYISIPAGMMRMNPVKFVLFTFAGIWPWAFGMALAGGAVSRYMAYAAVALPFLAAALVLIAIYSMVRKVWRRTHPTEQATYGD